MKKLLSLISAIGLASAGTVAVSNVVSCANADYNDISKIKKTDLTITKAIAKDYKVLTIEQAIVDVINTNISVDTNGNEVKKDSTGSKVKFEIADFDFKVGTESLSDKTDYKNDVIVKVTLKSDKAKKILKGEVSFTIEKNATVVVKKDMTTDVVGNKLSVEINKTKLINVNFEKGDLTSKTVNATSGDLSIVSTAVNGKSITLTAKKGGKTNLTLSAEGYNSIVIEVTVTLAAPKNMTTDVVGNKLSVEIGTPKKINVNFEKGDLTTKSVNANSADSKIATVNVTGKIVTVTGVKTGKVNITLSAEGYNNLVIEVTITAPAPKNMTTDVVGNKLSVEIGTPKKINVNFEKGDLTTKSVNANSVDSKIATVNVTGKVVTVTGVKTGKVNITLSAEGYNNFVIEVTITAPVPKNMTTDVVGNKLSVEIGTPKKINVNFEKGDLTTKSVNANSADSKIATVNVTGKVVTVTGVKTGKVNITLSAEGYNSFVIEVTITAPVPKNMTTDVVGNKLSVEIGTPKKINVNLDKTDKTNTKINTVVANNKIANISVSNKSITVNGVTAGKTTITISAEGYNNLVIDIEVTEVSLSK